MAAGKVASSKVRREGRWFWHCTAHNNASCWKDYWGCGAYSKRTYATKELAEQAGSQHARRKGHPVVAVQIRRGKRVRRKKGI